jgi:hypothetical protein
MFVLTYRMQVQVQVYKHKLTGNLYYIVVVGKTMRLPTTMNNVLSVPALIVFTIYYKA